jgi:hypothetical protein
MNIFNGRRKIRIGNVYLACMGCVAPLSEWEKRHRVIDMSDTAESPGFWVASGLAVVPQLKLLVKEINERRVADHRLSKRGDLWVPALEAHF